MNGIYVLLLFHFWIGIVKAQVGAAAELVSKSEIQADRLGMPNMKVAVRLRWKACLNVAKLPGLEVFSDPVAEEIG